MHFGKEAHCVIKEYICLHLFSNTVDVNVDDNKIFNPLSPSQPISCSFFLPSQCINNNIGSSLDLPDSTLRFVKDHPLLEDSVLPIGNRPRLIAKDVKYTHIVVERVRALDGNIYDIIFTGTGKWNTQGPVLVAVTFLLGMFYLTLQQNVEELSMHFRFLMHP